jgi:hypothetical protein
VVRYEDVGVGLAVGWAVPGPSVGVAVGVGGSELPPDDVGESLGRGTAVVAPLGVGMPGVADGSGDRLGIGVADPGPGCVATGEGLGLGDEPNPTLLL